MGIYDREYYRSEGSGFYATYFSQGRAWKWLLGANVVAFVLQLATRSQTGATVDSWFTDLFLLDPEKVARGEVWRLITGGFLHAFDWSHIVFNMLFLWWMGSEVEDIYGPKEFLGFYFAALLFSSLAYVGYAFASGAGHHRALGASGAVTAVMVLFAMHYPTRTVLLFLVIPVPVILLVVFNVLQDTIGLFGGSKQPIAFAAHLGGAAFGFLYGKFQWRVTNWLPSFAGLRRVGRARPRLRVYHGDPEAGGRAKVANAVAVDEHIEAELDAVLAKVARLGRSSLSEREQNILMRASEIYRQRRK